MYFWSNAVNNLKNAKSDIINMIKSKGVNIPDGVRIDELDGYVEQINSFDMSRSICAYSGGELLGLRYSSSGSLYGMGSFDNSVIIDKTIIGSNITDIRSLYRYQPEVRGNFYLYSNNITNAYGCLYSRNTSHALNIYVPYNSTTFKFITHNSEWITPTKPYWYSNNGIYYSEYYNIYVYPVENVAQARLNNND